MFAVKDIQPNPFRNIDHYPIDKERVQELRESLRATGFWDNVVARMVNGKPEIAYGHHRLAALKEEYKQTYQVDLIIKDLDDKAMIKIMANENMEEWKHSAETIMETVRAVVSAYAEGLIELSALHEKTSKNRIRYAPSFIIGDARDAIPSIDNEKPYTVESLADFLDWHEPKGDPKRKLKDAVLALELIEQGILVEKDFKGLTVFQARAVVEQARISKTRHETAAKVFEQQAQQAKTPRVKAAVQEKAQAARQEAKKQATAVGQAVSRQLKEGKVGYRSVAKVRMEVDKPEKNKLLWIDDFAEKLQAHVSAFLDSYKDPKRVRALEEMIIYRESMQKRTRKNLSKTFRVVAKRLSDYADRIDTEASQKMLGR